MTPRPTHHHNTTSAGDGPVVPLAIWPVAQTSEQAQRAGHYHPDCAGHPARMLPDLARRIITEYTQPGSMVVDLMAGTGTTLVEAVLAGRRAVGVELEPRLATVAASNLDYALPAEQRSIAEIHVGDARHLPDPVARLAGQVDAVVMSPPYAGDGSIVSRAAPRTGSCSRRQDTTNHQMNLADLGHARGAAYETAMGEIYDACHRLLRPGGRLVVVTTNTRRHGRTTDLAALTVHLTRAAGFAYLQHVIALHAPIRDGGLAAWPSYGQTVNVRHAPRHGEPAQQVVHRDVSVFQRPEVPDAH